MATVNDIVKTIGDVREESYLFGTTISFVNEYNARMTALGIAVCKQVGIPHKALDFGKVPPVDTVLDSEAETLFKDLCEWIKIQYEMPTTEELVRAS